MTKLNISPEWTPQERLQVVGQIAIRMRRNDLSLWHMVDFRERLIILSSSSAGFLELNRANILEGLEEDEST